MTELRDELAAWFATHLTHDAFRDQSDQEFADALLPLIERKIAEARAEAEAVKDRAFGNRRWMEGHLQGLSDGRAEADAPNPSRRAEL